MANSQYLQDEEKAERSINISNDADTVDPLSNSQLDKKENVCDDGDKSSLRPNAEKESIQQDIIAEEVVQDLEASQTNASTGPPYSIFTSRKKGFIIFMVAFGGFFSPLSANIYFPALNTLSRELHVSDTLINLTLTSYMIFQGLAPTIVGDLSDMAGRRPAYLISFVVYIGACIGIALQHSYAALFVLRCLQSSGSSGTIALANGVIVDISTPAERGTYIGYATSGLMIAPAIGPVFGGILSQYLGWRSMFWFLVILAAVYLLIFTVLFPETGRNVVGNGSIPPKGWNMSLLNYLEIRKARKSQDSLSRTNTDESNRRAQEELAHTRKLRWPNPLNTLHLVFQKDVGLILFYASIIYTAFYTVTTSAPSLFRSIYGLNDLYIGLSFLPFGTGAFIAPLCSGKTVDWNYRRTARRIGMSIDRKRGDDLKNFPIERARIEVVLPFLAIGNATLLCYGWVLQSGVSLAVPLVLHFIMGLTFTAAFNALSVLLVDLYPLSPATATAATNLVRCLMGAAGTAVILQMIEGMGLGWCFTFVAAVVLLFVPTLYVVFQWGPQWREERRQRMIKE